MPWVNQGLRGRWGGSFNNDCILMIFSVRLDETGTDGRSQYTIVGGAVATVDQWEALEAAWGRLLKTSNIEAYHWKEFNDPNDNVFGKWSEFKRKRFVEKQEKIVKKNSLFRVSVGVEDAVHADIKRRMKGIRGFSPESDYSLSLRYLMFATCEQLVTIDPECRLRVMIEDGPWAAGAMATYQRVARMTGPWKPAKHAHRLAGFVSVPKGERLSLEAADYLVGSEQVRMLAERRPKKGAETLSLLMTGPILEQWYEGMIKEKEARRNYARDNQQKRKLTRPPGQAEPNGSRQN